MKKETQQFSYEIYTSVDELPAEDAALVLKARAITKNAYAPYSHFNVGAAALLNNGAIVTGTNQENAAYPVGICAERVLLSTAATLFPDMPLQTMAISYHNEKGDNSHPVSPCGVCRQSLLEYEDRVHQPIRLILSGLTGDIYVIQRASQLLPLSFGKGDLK
ncbi:MAG: cytidine deaminase [Bacteroidetes bacterium]|nr:cytidine deaminase [Bacteroidota bacterium]